MKPQHFDILGVCAFAYITVFAFWAILTGINVPLWALIILAFIGIVGFAVDFSIVFFYFIRKRK